MARALVKFRENFSSLGTMGGQNVPSAMKIKLWDIKTLHVGP